MRKANPIVGLALVCGVASRAAAQATVPATNCDCAPSRATSAATPVRSPMPPSERLVTLTLRNTPLADALRVLNRQADLRLAYTDRVLPVDRQVSFVAVDVPVSHALAAVLKGTGLVVHPSASGQLVIMRAPGTDRGALPADSTQSAHQVAQGALQPAIGGGNDTPQAYRALVAAYFKALAHRP